MDPEETNNDNVPLFILKLRKLIDDGDGGDIVYWSKNGRNFIINDQTRFAKEKLPLYFKHNNMASFIRQLNMYGFNKVTKIDNTGLNQNYNSVEFYHPFFSKSQKNQLKLIKRKLNKGNVTNFSKIDDIQNLMIEVESMKNRQENVDKMLLKLREENSTLWREIAMLRQKHLKQQQLVDKLLRFLVDIVRNGMSLKRKAPLMLDATNRKILKTNDNAIYLPSTSSSGPIIRDITEEDNTSLPFIKDFQIDFPKLIDENKQLELKNDSIANNNNNSNNNNTNNNTNEEEYNKQKELVILPTQQNFIGIPELLEFQVPNNQQNYYSVLNTPTISIDESDIISDISNTININDLNSNNNNNNNNNNTDNNNDTNKINDNNTYIIITNNNNNNNSDNNDNNNNNNDNEITNQVDNSSNLLIPATNSNSNNSISKFSNEEFNEHVDIIDAQLDWLQNNFNPGNFNLDPSIFPIFPMNNQLTNSDELTSTSDYIPKAIMDSEENEKNKLEQNSDLFHFNEKGYLNSRNDHWDNDLIQTDILADLAADINS